MRFILLFFLTIGAFRSFGQVAYDPHSIPGWSRSGKCNGFILSPYDIVLDALDADVMPNQFRSPTFLKPSRSQQVDLKGFNVLRISGSGQFSRGQLQKMLSHLRKVHHVRSESIIIVDLREEPHGFINNHAITWYYGPLSYQYGKTPAQITGEEQRRIHFVKSNTHIIIYTITKHRDGMPFNKVPTLYKVGQVKSEQEVVESLGARYVRIPVTDHFRPENQDVDQFLEFVATLKPTDWLHFKCRGGRGRTTTFMAMYDMIKNPDVKKQDIIARQIFIDGVDLRRVTKRQHGWKKKLNHDRIQFIETFYDYVHASDGYGKMRWSDWILKHVPDAYEDDDYKVVD